MSYIIEDVCDYKTFQEQMPELYCGKPYTLAGEWDYDAEKFVPEYFEFEGEPMQKGYLPEDLLPYVIKGCKAVVEELEVDMEHEPYTYDDYLAERADKEEWKEK